MIGILTFVGTQSHGACLQAYALKRTVRELGYPAEIINYISPEMKKARRDRLPHPGQNPRRFLGAVRRYPIIRRRYALFSAFERDYLGVRAYADAIDYDRYDLVIVGSDQVWNLELTGNDMTFLLEGAEDEKKATYAASMGVEGFPADRETACIERIGKFRYLNVRERQLADYLRERMPGREINTVLDPTLLLQKEAWEALAGDAPMVGGKYLLVHYPYDSAENWNRIRELAGQNDDEIIFLTNNTKPRKDCRCLTAVGPTEYLNLIKYADAVVTGSFHTLSLSLTFEKDFYCTKSMIANRNVRLANLLELVGHASQTLENGRHQPDRAEIKARLDSSRAQSIECLKEMCESVTTRQGNGADAEEARSARGKARRSSQDNARADVPGSDRHRPLPKLFEAREDCCGCSACYAVCAARAIEMMPDAEGFLYPTIHADRCVGCLRCVSACAFKRDRKASNAHRAGGVG